MILLDTNYLIRVLIAGTREAAQISDWLAASREFCTAAIAWYEFLSGPVDDDGVDIVSQLIDARVLPFTSDVAREAALLFNATGRNRRLRVDAMIAATAIVADATLATANTGDFANFRDHGLRLE
jgi:predicted nucleic acid-binding protein